MVHPNRFRKLIKDYIQQENQIKPLVTAWASEQSIVAHSKYKAEKFSLAQRMLLHDVLSKQNQNIVLSEQSKINLSNLKNENCLTITTGHQLNLALGPVFVWYKILSVVKTCAALNAKQQDFQYVPIFWMASEDHDLEEINHVYHKGLKFSWNTDQTGAVGPMHTEGIVTVLEKLKTAFGPSSKNDFINTCIAVYEKAKDLAEATRLLINTFFGSYGLLVIDGNDFQLKQAAKDIFKLEFETSFMEDEVKKTNLSLKENGYHIQVNPRNINLFYLDKKTRGRWVREGEAYKVKDHSTELFSKSAIFDLLENQTESISPNAIMRPLYQETVLPNVTYVGGAGELAYWLQLKGAFERVQLPFPILMMRHQAVVLSSKSVEKMNKLQLTVDDFFNDLESLKKQVVKKHSPHDFNFDKERKAFDTLFSPLVVAAKDTDLSYEAAVKAAQHKALKTLDKLQKKLMRAEKKRLANLMQRVQFLYDEMYPDGVFQERRLSLAALMSDLTEPSKQYFEVQFNAFDHSLISYINE